MNQNTIIEREKKYIDEISTRYNYDENIKHLLYIIIPAFIIKYGINKEQMILNTFKDIRIMISNKKDKHIKAFYSSRPIRKNNKYDTIKFMVIQNYDSISHIELLDNLVHEFNHAINSYINEIKETKNYLYLRTGLTYRVYNKNNLEFIKKHSSYLLEEIINTKQTEEIIDIIKSFDESNKDISNTIYAINSETNHNYSSNSYYLESYTCKQILDNKTFINTLGNLRINGEIYDIPDWFDNITGEKGSYKRLIDLLNEIYNLEIEYSKKKFFKRITVLKIRSTSQKIMNIVNTFDNNVTYR